MLSSKVGSSIFDTTAHRRHLWTRALFNLQSPSLLALILVSISSCLQDGHHSIKHHILAPVSQIGRNSGCRRKLSSNIFISKESKFFPRSPSATSPFVSLVRTMSYNHLWQKEKLEKWLGRYPSKWGKGWAHCPPEPNWGSVSQEDGRLTGWLVSSCVVGMTLFLDKTELFFLYVNYWLWPWDRDL